MIHKHTWKRLKKYARFEWRCTSALNADDIESDDYDERGCLGTLVQTSRNRYLFCAPGTCVKATETRPKTMIIDAEYMRQVALFNESMRGFSPC